MDENMGILSEYYLHKYWILRIKFGSRFTHEKWIGWFSKKIFEIRNGWKCVVAVK